jgi:hypothetical protein
LVRRGTNRFYRTQRGVPLPDTVRWMRRAVQTIGLPDSPSAPPNWNQFVQSLGATERWMSNAFGPGGFRSVLLERLTPEPQRGVLLLQAGAEIQRQSRSSYGSTGLRLEEQYLSKGFMVQSLPLNPDYLQSRIVTPRSPSVVHITAQLAESFTPREVFLLAGDGAEPIRAEMLTNLFAQWPENQLRPFVILEATDNRFDRGRPLLLRNALATRLFAENTRGVLAIGPYPSQSLSRTIATLLEILKRKALAIGDLHTLFWSAEEIPAPALFTLDPDLPVWD